MHRILLALALTLVAALPAAAQDARYVSDEVFIVLHSGPGTSYRWLAKLNPGTRLSVSRTAEEGEWSEVTTDRGTVGWVRSEFLSASEPAQVRLASAEARAEQLAARNTELETTLADLKSEKQGLASEADATGAELEEVSQELAHLKQISGKAVQLDDDNRRLAEETEQLRTQVEMLESENLRLQEKLRSEDFINGALAVLMGVIITLVVPRLWPKRRKASSWA